MKPLSIDPLVPEVTRTLRDAGRVVLTAPPGSGKTTRIPPALAGLDRRTGDRPPARVVLVEPRRLAAVAAAARIAEERGLTLGREVGYQVRFEKRLAADTALVAVTEGVLLRQLQSDPFLKDVHTVVLDEFHERSTHADLLLGMLREVTRDARPDLQVLVMSATLEAGRVARYLEPCAVIEAAEEHAPVAVHHAERTSREPLEQQVREALLRHWTEASGHALVFLPGWREIQRCRTLLDDLAHRFAAELSILHGSLGLDAQRRILRCHDRRQIILATNVAESSVTVDGVHLVIDSGLERRLHLDPASGLERLRTERISRQSADQRAGRAGRQGPGIAARLWTRAEHASLHEARPAEITRVDLAPVLLELAAWGAADPAQFEFLEPPPAHAIAAAATLLQDLRAMDAQGRLTSLGRRMRALPTHPRLARLVLAGAEGGFAEQAATAAALLEEGERAADFEAAAGHARSDLLVRMDRLRRSSSARGGDSMARVARSVDRVRADLCRRLGTPTATRVSGPADLEDALLQALTLAFPDRVARRRPGTPDRARMVGGSGVVLSPRSVVHEGDLFLVLQTAAELDHDRETRVTQASYTCREWLERLFPQAVVEKRDTFFDAERRRVRSTVTVHYRDLPLEEPRETAVDASAGWPLLVAAIEERVDGWIERDEDARALLRRVAFLVESGIPAGPPLDRSALVNALAGRAGERLDLGSLPPGALVDALHAALGHGPCRELDRLAPEFLVVPSGSRIRLRYEAAGPPVLAVRLQELFGLRETPRVAAGRQPVLLHLLGPNHRPVQITQDLESFWNTTYHQVRKDLRARYPRHSWPEDPWNATAVRGTGRRRGP